MSESEIRVLLLEDDPQDAELVKFAIRDADARMELHWVTRVSEATEALAAHPYDVVLSDLSLPDSNGGQTIKSLYEAAEETPIIVLTSLDDHALGVELLDAGAQDYIPKDQMTGDNLERAIRHSIQRHQQLFEAQRLLAEVLEGRDLLQAKNNKLEKLYQQAHDFVDNASHEFRTPLTVIKEYASLISDGLAGEVNSEQIRMLKVVEDRADDLNTMVDDMLDSSRLDAGLMGAWRKQCRVADILNHVTATLDRKAQVKGVQLDYEIAADLPELYCDAEKVGRVLTNLAVNAIKFCGNPGRVRITANAKFDSPDIEFCVEDNGPGIAPDALQQIFERFEQLGTNSRGSCKGFGLGLAIAKELVDLNLGRMTVESQPGDGSCFRFTVPKNEPLELVRRHLAQVARKPDCPPLISLVAVRIRRNDEGRNDEGRNGEGRNDEGRNDEGCEVGGIDSFLNYLLRRNDLLLKVDGGEWLLALPTGKQELESYFQRSRKAWNDANRNRPTGPLPVVEYECLGFWRTPEDRETILATVAEHVAKQGVTCV